MLSVMRNKFGPAIVSAIIGLIALVFIFSGVFNPKATRGMHEGTVAGTVNGDPISLGDFNRELTRRMEFFKNMGGGKLTDAQLKGFRIKEGVFSELVNKKLMNQAAVKSGTIPGDEEIRSKIREIPAFQNNGNFDTLTYKRVLEANNYTPSSFENLMREDLAVQHWTQFFKDRVKVSEEELKDEFVVTRDKRDIKYILLTSESGSKGVKIDPALITKFLADSSKTNLARVHFEQGKKDVYKDKTFDQVKDQIAKSILASEKSSEVTKINQELAAQIVPLLSGDKKSDAKVNSLLKVYGVEVKYTKPVPRTNSFIAGVGEAKDLMADAFAKKSPIDPKQGGKAKIYTNPGSIMVALVAESQTADLADFPKSRVELLGQVTTRKEHDLLEAFMKKLNEQAKIEKNDSVVGETPDET